MTCKRVLEAQGLPTPRTCPDCGLGPCPHPASLGLPRKRNDAPMTDDQPSLREQWAMAALTGFLANPQAHDRGIARRAGEVPPGTSIGDVLLDLAFEVADLAIARRNKGE